MRFLPTVLLLYVLLVARPACAADELSAGLAVVDITPPVGMRMCGYFNERFSTAAHDPILIKALVLVQGDVKTAFVACDLIGVSNSIARQGRELAEKKTGIPADQIVVHCTHSHTGPLFFGVLCKYQHDQAVAKLGNDPAEKVNFPERLVQGVASAVEQAAKNVRHVQLSAGRGQEARLPFNRRFHMKDGSVQFNPGRKNPAVVRVAGPIDPDLGLLLLSDAAGKPLCSLANFALHLDTVGGTEYSADYPFHLQERLREKLGPEFLSLFGTGTCGDINHIDTQNEQQLSGRPECQRIGRALGDAVLAALPTLAPQAAPQLAVKRAVVEVPTQVYSEAETKKAAVNMAKIGGRELSFLEEVEACKITDLAQHYPGPTLGLEVQVIRLSNEAAVVCLPGEVFVELGLAIKQASPFKTTLVVELCNDCPAYIPTRKAFAEGSYETVNSRAAPGCGEAMVETAIKLLKAF